MDSQTQEYYYFAFISYKREDEEWAKWLQKKLESYSLPTAIRKENPELPNNIRPVFRDQSELAGGNLKAEIEKGLNGSKYLIVICSPRSAHSPWVSKEVQHFIDQGREEYIIPFIIGGTPNSIVQEDECFPEGLRQLTGEKEILGININEMGRDAAAIKVIARMFDIRFDSLWQRYKRDASKRKWIIRIAAFMVIALLCVVAVVITNKNHELDFRNVQLNAANDSITVEKDRIHKVSVHQSLALAESKIREGDIGYALTLMTSVKDNESIINQDKEFTLRYNEVIRLLSDSLSRSRIMLIDIVDTRKDSVRVYKFKDFSSVIWEYNKEDVKPEHFNYEQKGVIIMDSVFVYSRVNNRDMTITAIYDGEGDVEYDGVSGYEPDKNGIFVLDRKTRQLLRFISAWGWYPSQCHPIAIDNSGTKLIYRTGGREYDYVRIYDFELHKSQFIDKIEGHDWDSRASVAIDGAFSIGDYMFALNYSQRNATDSKDSTIKIFKTGTVKPFLTFSFPDCKWSFWDDNNYFNIVCGNYTYIFDIGKENLFSELSYQQAVDNFSLSPINNDIAVLTSNKTLHITDSKRKKLKLRRELPGSPDNLEFSPIDNSLWITDGYDMVSVLDPRSGKLTEITYDGNYPPHHWEHDISFIDGGKRCLTLNHYGGEYRLFDTVSRKFIEDDEKDDKTEHPQIVLNLQPIDSVDLHNGQLSAIKVSQDKKHILRGYFSGRVVLSDYDTYIRLFNRLGISYTDENK